MRKTAEQCFREKYFEGDPNLCWGWIGALNNKGRGNFRGKSAPRFAWTIYKGEIPDGMNVLHSCDNPACVNPQHLFLGTQKDNVQDMIVKGRKKYGCGENAFHRKLNWDSVNEIRGARKAGETATSIGSRFGIGKTQVYRIERGEQWILGS